MPEEKLLNLMQLANDLGVPYQYVKDAHTAGLPLMGGRTLRSAALTWLTQNPDFRAQARFIRAHSKKKRRGT